MEIKVTFIQDENVEDVEVVVRAAARNEITDRILRSIEETKNGAIYGGAIYGGAITNEKAIDVGEVVIISKSGRYLSVKTIHDEYVLKDPLYKIEERLDQTQFVRISQSEIVNLKFVEGWSLEGGGIIKIELVNGISSYTSRRYAVEIRKLFGNRR